MVPSIETSILSPFVPSESRIPTPVSRFQTVSRSLFGDDPRTLSIIVVPVLGALNSVPDVLLVRALSPIEFVQPLVHLVVLVPILVNSVYPLQSESHLEWRPYACLITGPLHPERAL